MTPPGVLFSLRVSQGIYSSVVLALLSYAIHEYALMSRSISSSPTEVILGLVAASVSLVGLSCIFVKGHFQARSRTGGDSRYSTFAVDIIISFLNFAAFLAMVVFVCKPLKVAHQDMERGSQMAKVVKAATVFAAFNYAVWTAAATIAGIEISKGRRRSNMNPILDMTEEQAFGRRKEGGP